MPSFKLLQLPSELVIRILSYLDLPPLISCLKSCRVLHTTISNSVLLQYIIELQAAGFENNSNCTLNLSERLRRLKAREQSFLRFRPDFTKTIPIPHDGLGIYELSGGVFALGESSRKVLPFLKLPSAESEEAKWEDITMLDPDRFIVDAGVAIEEHDLVVLITSSVDPSYNGAFGQSMSLELNFIRFSDNTPHPLAQSPTLVVDRCVFRRPILGIEICGDHLALVTGDMHIFGLPGTYENKFRVYDWKRGVLKMEVNWGEDSASIDSYGGYTSAIFLSPDALVVPNHTRNSLELWRIPSEPVSADDEDVVPDVTLWLPDLAPTTVLLAMACRGAPNPLGLGSIPRSTQPFRPTARDSLLVFQIHMIQSDDEHRVSEVMLLMHRRALLDMLESAPAVQDVRDLMEESGMGSAVAEFCLEAPWDEWGPPVCRWIHAGASNSFDWITTTYGQRFVSIQRHAPGESGPIEIFDFNRYNIARARTELEVQDNPNFTISETGSLSPSTGIFEDEVTSTLPVLLCKSTVSYDYCDVLIDEDIVLGLTRDEEKELQAVDVLHFG